MFDKDVLMALEAMERRLTQRTGEACRRIEAKLDALEARLDHQESAVDSLVAALLTPDELALLGAPLASAAKQRR